MPELLVRVVDKYVGPDRLMQAGSRGRGDVIVVKDDDQAVITLEIQTLREEVAALQAEHQQLREPYPWLLNKIVHKTDSADLLQQALDAGHCYWSEIELTSPQCIIVKTDLPLIEARGMRGSELGDIVANPFLHVSVFKLNLDVLIARGYGLPAHQAARALHESGGKRATPFITIPANELRSVKVRKPPIVDPAVIGRSTVPGVIDGN